MGQAESRTVARNIANLVKDFGDERWQDTMLFENGSWHEGCKVCALGAAIELLVPHTILYSVRDGDESDILKGLLLPYYVRRYGDVAWQDFDIGTEHIVVANDKYQAHFSQLSQVLDAHYKECLPDE